MVLDFTDSKNSCYLLNLQSDDSEVSLARMIAGVPEQDVDRIVNNTSKFFKNLAHKVGLNIIGSGPSKTAICCSLGPNIQDMLCQTAQMQLVQFVKLDKGYIEAKLVWFDELSSKHPRSSTSDTGKGASFYEIRSKRENFIRLFNNSWISLVKVVLGDGDKGIKFYRKTVNGTLIPETVLKSPQSQTFIAQSTQASPMYNSDKLRTPYQNYGYAQVKAPRTLPQTTFSPTLTASSLDGTGPMLRRPLKRRRQGQHFGGLQYSSSRRNAEDQNGDRGYAAQSTSPSLQRTYQAGQWRKSLPQRIIA